MRALRGGVDVDRLEGNAVSAQPQHVEGVRRELFRALARFGVVHVVVGIKHQIQQPGEAGPEVVTTRARKRVIVAANGQSGAKMVAVWAHTLKNSTRRWRIQRKRKRR